METLFTIAWNTHYKRHADQAITQNILRHWKKRPAQSITRRDGVLLLDKIVDRGARVMANCICALLARCSGSASNAASCRRVPL